MAHGTALRTITALETQKRDHKRVSVFLDGDFSFGLAYVIAAPLKIGQQLSPANIADLRRRDEVEKAKHDAIRLVSLRPRSAFEVRQRLERKGFDEDVIEEAVKRLKEIELLDDVAFAHYWLEQRETFKPRGRRAIQHELRLKGIGADVIELTLSNLDELGSARRAAQRRPTQWDSLPLREFQTKLAQFLQRRGFEYETIKQITNETWQAVADSADSSE